MSKEGFRFVDRDFNILREIDRWRVITGRQVCVITDFSGQRACDRRLNKLMKAGYICRNKYLYGFPSIYRLTDKAKILINVPKKPAQIRLEQIVHDSHVTDTAIYIAKKYQITFDNITTEKQLHRQDGFSNRKHRPDFIFVKNEKVICVEVELTMKSKSRMEQNVKSNFENYDGQLWVVPDLKGKIAVALIKYQSIYSDILIMSLDEVISDV